MGILWAFKHLYWEYKGIWGNVGNSGIFDGWLGNSGESRGKENG